MKYCLLLIGIFLTVTATAQFPFNFYVQAGGNYTTIRIPRTTGIETSDGGFGGQVGIGTEYHTVFGYFVYLGAGIRQQSFEKDSLPSYHGDTVSQFKYNPVFINVPVGIGWQFPLKKNLDLKLYGGLNVQIGVAGKVRKHTLYYSRDSVTQQPVLTREESNSHTLKFGRASRRNVSYDFASTNFTAHLGAGILFNQSLELNVFYHYGFTNFLPNQAFAEEINKLSYFEVNAKIYIPRAYFGSKKHGDY
jgi:hypothetical protein